MVATVTVKELNGAGPDYTTVDDDLNPARFKTKDEAASDLNYPCVIPGAGVLHYSYWKSHGLDLAGAFSRINNVRWYTDEATDAWTLGTDGKVIVGQLDATPTVTAQGCADGSYAQATGVEGTTGHYLYDVTNGHPVYKSGVGAAPVVISEFTSDNMMVVDLDNHDVAEKTKHVVTQVIIDDDATQGLQGDTVITFSYDEI